MHGTQKNIINIHFQLSVRLLFISAKSYTQSVLRGRVLSSDSAALGVHYLFVLTFHDVTI